MRTELKCVFYKVALLIWVMAFSCVQYFCQSPQLTPTDFSTSFEITIDHTKVAGTDDLIDFPVLLDLVDPDLKTTSNGGAIEHPNGYDIQVRGECNKILPHEIEVFNGSTGRMLVWVRVSELHATSATNLYLSAGNPDIDDNTSSTATWSADYESVWHLGGSLEDASSNDNDGSNNGSNDTAGSIENGQDFNGTSDYIQTTSSGLQTAEDFSFSVWFNSDATDFCHHLLWQGESTGNGWGNLQEEMHLSLGAYTDAAYSDKIAFFLGDIDLAVDPDVLTITAPFTDLSSWHHAYVNVMNMSSAPSAELYLDGILVGTDIGSTARTGRSTWDTDVRLGRPGSTSRFYDGALDEVRTAVASRSADWIATEYSNQSAPTTFFTLNSSPTVSLDDQISGRVFVDQDADGIQDGGEAAYPNVDVRLYSDNNGDGLQNAGDVLLSTSMTDANGDYTFSIGPKSIEHQISSSGNDAQEELNTGTTSTTSTTLTLGNVGLGDPYLLGLRYEGLDIPNGAVITKAYIEFVSSALSSSAVELSIAGQDVDNADPFVAGASNVDLSTRSMTSERVNWSPGAWPSGVQYYSPDVSDVIQEIVDRGGWSAGNDMALLIDGGPFKRNCHSFDDDPSKAPILHIEFYEDPMILDYVLTIDESTISTQFTYTNGAQHTATFTQCTTEADLANHFAIQMIELCANGIDDDGDGKIDSDDPECMDCDGDLVTNAFDIDDDNDGIPDADEEQSDADPNSYFGNLNPIPDGATNVLTGTTITYNKTFPANTIRSQSYGYYMASPIGETDFKEFEMSFSPPISDVSFAVTNVDNIKEEFNLIVYDEFGNAYDLSKEGLIHLGSYLDQEGDGSEFRTNVTVIGAGGMGFDLEQATARFDFPGKVSRIHYDLKALDGTNFSVGKPYYHFIDTDADGVIDKCDLDSDNDGIYDVTEAGGVDADLDGRIGTGGITDTDGDGWSDIVDGDDGGVALADPDVDTDGKKNRIDDDSDGDGCTDVIEAGFPDGDGDGRLGGLTPPTVGSNGVVTSGGL